MVTRRSTFALLTFFALLLGALPGVACDTIYYKTMKRFGMEKRDILVKRVRDARKSQEEAKENFQTAVERFKAVVDVEGSSLEHRRARALHSRSRRVHQGDGRESVHVVIDVRRAEASASAASRVRPTTRTTSKGALKDGRLRTERQGNRVALAIPGSNPVA
jgi:Protein of unknown function (DUF2959)